MVLVRSITFDDEEIGQAVVSASTVAANQSQELFFIDKLRAGDAAAFETLIDRYSDDIYALLYRRSAKPVWLRWLNRLPLRTVRQCAGT